MDRDRWGTATYVLGTLPTPIHMNKKNKNKKKQSLPLPSPAPPPPSVAESILKKDKKKKASELLCTTRMYLHLTLLQGNEWKFSSNQPISDIGFPILADCVWIRLKDLVNNTVEETETSLSEKWDGITDGLEPAKMIVPENKEDEKTGDIYCQFWLTAERKVAWPSHTIRNQFGCIRPTVILQAGPLLRYNDAVKELHIRTRHLVTSLGFYSEKRTVEMRREREVSRFIISRVLQELNKRTSRGHFGAVGTVGIATRMFV